MVEKTTVVINKTGLHARPAGELVKLAKSFASDLKITNLSKNPEKEANLKAMIAVLSLAMTKGSEIRIKADGPDEAEAADALIALIDSGFGEAE